jgi:hypothetical protein
MAWLAILHNLHFYSTRGLRKIYYLLMHMEAVFYVFRKRNDILQQHSRTKTIPFSPKIHQNTELLSSENALKANRVPKPEE